MNLDGLFSTDFDLTHSYEGNAGLSLCYCAVFTINLQHSNRRRLTKNYKVQAMEIIITKKVKKSTALYLFNINNHYD